MTSSTEFFVNLEVRFEGANSEARGRGFCNLPTGLFTDCLTIFLPPIRGRRSYRNFRGQAGAVCAGILLIINTIVRNYAYLLRFKNSITKGLFRTRKMDIYGPMV